ncbi:hypothetical protein CcaverHIS002_0208990 [Cutaneotrichosporon cavernicola]|uniref:Major facilitator superfamily (MFS) profile domain-containing protein n=1 Tax=Cutaneotrichosporon cavernicola TaxID=279322 RepID=A0AA48IIM4_9TREE|nr:uncharacterized protein CcaverHIS019_0209000 [Cutaneotrichosporon cavernicola]BEI81739.1 hypothetical protein CcaverHIS002_0208990 [Cutaneotrichosporon cavernicola]BEI89538.1 hypothetical protein CcaverHIS019_0209000 [Cutaneotrichosporon cavernicola]BEI97311.1 hypothetical protein CcaverHIS631_0209000 [Cutaneotrichosporon cavernicola]BEJ05085.1 hypothetical protein CcaverHIS641_0209020 [Cutaneotrichosporon cavernicola]
MASTGTTPHLIDQKEAEEIHHIDNYDDEKASAQEIHDAYVDIDHGYDQDFINRTTRKIDWRLIPPLIAMYCISSIDRKNVSLARAANKEAMHAELDLGSSRYNIITLLFFPPYIIFELPSQLGLRRFGPRYWLASAVFLWGLVTIGLGFSNNWVAMASMRALLGMFEACLFPGAAYLIACWYPRKQMARRSAVFYITAIAIGGLGNLLGYAISLMHGIAGLSGWRWIFIIEGILTVVIAIIGFVLIVDFPDRSTFLTPEEKEMIITRIDRDRGDSEADPMTKAKFISYMCEPKIWLFAVWFCVTTLGSYSMSYFLPRILRGMGFTDTMSQVLLAPPYVWAVVPALAHAYFADKYRNMRAWMILSGCLQSILGTILYSQLPEHLKAGRYAGTFLAVGAANGNVGLIISWAQCSIRNQSKRGYTSALIVAFGGIGGILASLLFMDKESKQGYPTGVWSVVGLNAFQSVTVIGLRFFFAWRNKLADRGKVVIEGDAKFRYQL